MLRDNLGTGAVALPGRNIFAPPAATNSDERARELGAAHPVEEREGLLAGALLAVVTARAIIETAGRSHRPSVRATGPRDH
jgi:hypothetical protein